MADLLIITNRTDFTADFLIQKLHNLKISFYRLNTEDFPLSIDGSVFINADHSEMNICSLKGSIDFEKLKGIWFRRPVKPDVGNLNKNDKIFAERECTEFMVSLWNLLYDRNWVSHPECLRIAERKMLQLKKAVQVGFMIPDTIISNNSIEIKTFIENHDEDVIAKPLSSGDYCEGKSAIYTNRISLEDIFLHQSGISLAPIIIQKRVDKISDVRVNVFGDKVFSFLLKPKRSNRIIDWRILRPNEIQYEYINTPTCIKEYLNKFVKLFSIKFGAFDFVINKSDDWIFLENNPNGQWAWLEQVTNVKMSDALIELLLNSG